MARAIQVGARAPSGLDDALDTRVVNTSTQPNDFDAEKWVSAIHESLQTVAYETLGVEEAKITRFESHEADASKIRGAYISLVECDCSAPLGLRCSRQDCENLARMMLELGNDESAQDEDISGTLAEFANIIAGVVKSKVGLADLKLGISMVVSGRVTPPTNEKRRPTPYSSDL